MSRYPVNSVSFPALADVHGGTGRISKAKHIVVPDSVAREFTTQLDFTYPRYDVTVMSFQIDGNAAPNWFGVAFRSGIRSFDAVNIFFHPSPGHAGMQDGDYAAHVGDWPKLFRYAEMLGSQLAIGASNQIVIVPFFNNASYLSTGIFAPNWQEIVTDIVTAARAEALQSSMLDPVILRDVVLSDFSFGRHIMHTMRMRAPGLGGYLREIWDFDGVGPGTPYTSAGVRGILYDQHSVRDARSFHVPPQRWLGFHHKVVPSVHSNIPDMLGWHAATVSGVGL